MTKVDPITFAVVQKKLISIADGMRETGVRSGFTTYMYEVMDCLFAILDSDAGVIAESKGLFLGSLGPAVQNCVDVIGKENFKPGDVIISSLPVVTGNHTSDALLFAPIFYNDKLFGYSVAKSHWIDLGAKTSYPTDATNIFEEGLRIPPVKLYKKGVLQSDILGIIRCNSRAPDDVWGDMQAQLAGCRYGDKHLIEILDKYGINTVKKIIIMMYDYSERITRLAVEKIPDGVYTAEDFMDNNGIDLDKLVRTQMTITIKGSDMTVDLTGSDPEQQGPMNGLWVTTLSSVRSNIKSLTSPGVPTNEGFNRPIKVIAPEGCVHNAGPTVPCFLCGNVGESIGQCITKALFEALPGRLPACGGADPIGQGFYGTNPRTGKYWTSLTPVYTGQGAGLKTDGLVYLFGPCQNIPHEILEASFPLFIENAELIKDSGGAGKNRGGVGTRLSMRLLSPASFYAFIERGRTPHWGAYDGKPGLRNYALIKSKKEGEFEVLKTSGVHLEKDDMVIVTAGGGGGYGNPLERDTEKVRMDVLNGFVSTKCAREDYGVVIDPETFEVDAAATKALRSN